MKLKAVKQNYFKECVYVVLKPVGTGSYRLVSFYINSNNLFYLELEEKIL